ncbi:MAG TPA: ATP-binding cassette domain-containing protein [Acidimicrobiales bacterium]|nr:ATP-binding cassette domain-containing protein [Acidimicrobiales bacterium]
MTTTEPAAAKRRSTIDPNDEIIQTRGLSKTYPGDVQAVIDLDLAVHRGEVFGLLGPNGAGKSTTAGMLTTRVIPTAGSATIAGIDVAAKPAQVRRFIGVVPQSNTLDRSLTVFENLYFHGRFFGMSKQAASDEATRLVDRMKLNRFSSASVAALSGGMAQRLMLARAVMHRPAVLFLDEPTTGLDPQSRLALYEIVQDLNADGQTVLLTTHYMEEADELCDRIAIIDHGRILALDTPEGLKRQVGADTIISLSASGELDELARRIEADVRGVSAVHRNGDVLEIAVTTDGQVVSELVTAATEAGVAITDLRVSEPTLETVFIHLTGKELRD